MEQDTTVQVPVMDNSNQDSNKQDDKKQSNGKGWKIATAIISIIAICGIGFGVYGMFFHKTEVLDDSNETVPVIQEDVSVVQEDLPSVETINALLREKYELFDYNGFATGFGRILSAYAYNEDSEGLSEAGKLFLVIRKEYPSPSCYDDASCRRTVTYEDLNNKYHEYFGDSVDIAKGIDYAHKDIMIGIDSVKYIDGNDSFEIVYPNGIGGIPPSMGYYTNIVDIKRIDDGNITAEAIVTKVDAEDAKLYGFGACQSEFDCPMVDMSTLEVESFLYNYIFIEEDGTYKLTDIVKQ